jgi:hypothetical protein
MEARRDSSQRNVSVGSSQFHTYGAMQPICDDWRQARLVLVHHREARMTVVANAAATMPPNAIFARERES